MGYAHTTKRCRKCEAVQPVRNFYDTKSGRDSHCKPCRRAVNREYLSKRNVVVARMKAKDPHYYRSKKLLKMYGITHEQYEAMWASQNGLCAICLKPETRTLYGAVAFLVVDHDHATEQVRGLLCHNCNIRLGTIEDEGFCLSARAYLAKPRLL